MDCDIEEMVKHKPVCYFVMNNDWTEEQNVFFERPCEGMKNHLKLLFIRVKLENTTTNKILINGGVAVNLMPHFFLSKIGKYDTDMRPNNMVLSNYEGKTRHTLGVIQFNMIVGSVTKPTVFMVIASKSSYNLLLGREWIHGV